MFRHATILLALIAFPALGGGPLDGVRASAGKAREAVSAVRADQMSRRAELNTLSARIETLKAQTTGKLLAGSELDGALKRSQELSDQLTGLAQAMAARETELESANLALLTELSAELSRLRSDFDRQTERSARLILIKRLREARAEREQVRALLPATKVPALLAAKQSDDPEDLLEQADLMHDREDQVRKELKGLEVRIAERKEERDLDRRVNQFLNDESMFDEGDRRLRITRETTIPAAAKTDTAAGFAADTNGAQNKTPTTSRNQVGVPYNSANDLFGGTGANTMGASASPSARESNDAPPPADPAAPPPTGAGNNPGGNDPAAPTVKISVGKDARPVVSNVKRIAGGEDEDLEDLEIQRAKLKGLAEELKARARALEKKAAELR